MNIIFCKKDVTGDHYLEMIYTFAEKTHNKMNIQIFEDVEQMLFKTSEVEYSIDLLFIDVEFSGMSGFDAVTALRKQGFRGEVIFLTDIPDRWDKAFDIHAFHYVIERGCSRERFEEILKNAMKEATKKQEETIVFTCAGERVIVPVREIKYFTVNERWITVHYGDGESFEFFSRIGKIEQHLLNKGFVRIHRACIVAVRFITSIKYNQVILQDGTVLALARGKYPIVKEQFERSEGLGEVL